LGRNQRPNIVSAMAVAKVALRMTESPRENIRLLNLFHNFNQTIDMNQSCNMYHSMICH
jgi:hypothetical protein